MTYAELKAARKCVSCKAGLQELDTGVRCVECTEVSRECSRRIREARPDHVNAQQRSRYAADPAKHKRWKADNYVAKKLRRECTRCSDQAAHDSNLCRKHRDAGAKASREYQRRTRAAKAGVL